MKNMPRWGEAKVEKIHECGFVRHRLKHTITRLEEATSTSGDARALLLFFTLVRSVGMVMIMTFEDIDHVVLKLFSLVLRRHRR